MSDKLKKERGIGAFLRNNSFIILAGFCTAIIMLVVYFCYELVPFGDRTILRMDMYHQYGPLFAELYERLAGGDSLLYSWTSGLGGSFLGNYLNYLSSPFIIVVMLFGHENIPEAIATMILLKAVFASGAFTYYIKASHKVHDATSAGFGVLYSCCGFFIAYYWNVMWLDAFWLFPLVILGIEKIINEGKLKLYFAALVMTLLTNYYMAYMVCIFSVIYFLAYFIAHVNIDEKFADTAYDPEKRPPALKRFFAALKNRVLIDRCARFGAASLGAGIFCACLLVPLYFILDACSATSGTMPETYKSYFSIFDFLANSLASVNPTIRSSGEDVLPNIYCG
ncbi:MAG: YfhO family protein, partial [Clostridiales bacterium]|nr:YfhO family protein [Clostridiales bacterium]